MYITSEPAPEEKFSPIKMNDHFVTQIECMNACLLSWLFWNHGLWAEYCAPSLGTFQPSGLGLQKGSLTQSFLQYCIVLQAQKSSWKIYLKAKRAQIKVLGMFGMSIDLKFSLGLRSQYLSTFTTNEWQCCWVSPMEALMKICRN